jgi:hypothetical protein
MVAMVANSFLLAASRDPFVIADRQTAGVKSWRSMVALSAAGRRG